MVCCYTGATWRLAQISSAQKTTTGCASRSGITASGKRCYKAWKSAMHYAVVGEVLAGMSLREAAGEISCQVMGTNGENNE